MDTVYLVVGKIVVWGVCWVVGGFSTVAILAKIADQFVDRFDADGHAFDWLESMLDALAPPFEHARKFIGLSEREAEYAFIALFGLIIWPFVFLLALLELFCIHPIRRRVRARRAAAAAPPAVSA